MPNYQKMAENLYLKKENNTHVQLWNLLSEFSKHTIFLQTIYFSMISGLSESGLFLS